jgi:hypothetical protein
VLGDEFRVAGIGGAQENHVSPMPTRSVGM